MHIYDVWVENAVRRRKCRLSSFLHYLRRILPENAPGLLFASCKSRLIYESFASSSLYCSSGFTLPTAEKAVFSMSNTSLASRCRSSRVTAS